MGDPANGNAHCMRCNHRSLATKSRCRIAAPEAQDHVNVGLQPADYSR